jgi:hypothetical protein
LARAADLIRVRAVVAADAQDLAGPGHRGERLRRGERAPQPLAPGRHGEGETARGGDHRLLANGQEGGHVGGDQLGGPVRLARRGYRRRERRPQLHHLRAAEDRAEPSGGGARRLGPVAD